MLYRRYQSNHLDSSGDLIPQYFEFPKPKDDPKSGQSFLAASMAEPMHALHPNCNDGRALPPGKWGVLQVQVGSIPKDLPDPEGKVFYFRPVHAPYAGCGAHTELFCSDIAGGGSYVLPGKTVRHSFRIKMSRVLIPVPELGFVEIA